MENGDEEQREGENERGAELKRDKEIDVGKGDPLSSFLSPFWFAKVRNSDTRPSVLAKSFGPLRMGRDPREQITLFICRTGRATTERSSSFLGDDNA